MISNTIFRRSVLKNILSADNRLINRLSSGGAAIGAYGRQGKVCMSVKTGEYALFAACNELECQGVEPEFVNAAFVLPYDYDERLLKQQVRRLSEWCNMMSVCIADVAITQTKAVHDVICTVSAMGGVASDNPENASAEAIQDCNSGDGCILHAESGQDIVMTGVAGISGIRSVIDRYRNVVCSRYSQRVIDEAYGDVRDLSAARAARIARSQNCSYVASVQDGGIFAALWHLAEENGIGIDVDFRSIRMRQEIIEVCELLDINPYELSSIGCLLMTSGQGCDIVDVLRENGIDSVIIGRTTSDKAKILRAEEEIRYLDTPRTEEAERIIYGERQI